MPAFQDLTNFTFGRLTVIGRNPVNTKRGNVRWDCACGCGNCVTVVGGHLKSEHTKSCGCWIIEANRLIHTTHGHRANGIVSTEYKRWECMIKRCYDPKHPQFHRYGGRDIKVFRPWRLAFEPYLAFIRSIGFTGAKGQTLDRINNDHGYGPDNLRVTDAKGQNRNTSRNRLVTAFGQTLCVAEWAERTGINYTTLYHRLYSYHWTPERAFSTPVDLRFHHPTP